MRSHPDSSNAIASSTNLPSSVAVLQRPSAQRHGISGAGARVLPSWVRPLSSRRSLSLMPSRDCNLLCRPARWTDVIVFYLANYVTHAATVISRPGERPGLVVLGILTAILFPGGGIVF